VVLTADRVQRELDDNADARKRSQKEQDGSEIRDVGMVISRPARGRE
jgi:hypothetical protein